MSEQWRRTCTRTHACRHARARPPSWSERAKERALSSFPNCHTSPRSVDRSRCGGGGAALICTSKNIRVRSSAACGGAPLRSISLKVRSRMHLHSIPFKPPSTFGGAVGWSEGDVKASDARVRVRPRPFSSHDGSGGPHETGSSGLSRNKTDCMHLAERDSCRVPPMQCLFSYLLLRARVWDEPELAKRSRWQEKKL